MIYLITNQPYTNLPENIVECGQEFLITWIDNHKDDVLSCDSETEGMDFNSKKIVMFQIGDDEDQFVIDVRNTSILFLKPYLENPRWTKLFQNVKFDYKFLKKYGIICENVYDTMLAEQVLTCGMDNVGSSLNDLTIRYCNKSLNKEVRNKFVGIGSTPFTIAQIMYGAEDVKYLRSIMTQQIEKGEKDNLLQIIELENKVSLAFADMEYNGIGLNTDKWLEVAKVSSRQLKEKELELDDIILNDATLAPKYKLKYLQSDMFAAMEDIRQLDINWNSPAQVLKIFKNIEPALENVNGKELIPIAHKHSLIREYIRFKNQSKLVSSYGTGFIKNINKYSNRIHTSFYQILETGRCSSSEPNMQNIPHTNLYRNCFIPGIPGYVFVSGDYSSQELTVIAVKSKDPVWMEALRRGQDLHSICAELIYKDKWKSAAEEDCEYYKSHQKCKCKKHKTMRTNVKTLNFGLAYGMSKFKLSNTLLISLKEAEELMAEYFKTFPKIKTFLDTLALYGVQNGMIKTFRPYLRKRYYSNWKRETIFLEENKKEKGEIERCSMNTPIQGSSADMTKHALYKIRECINKNNYPVLIVLQVHDEINTICLKEFAEEWSVIMKDIMEKSALTVIPEGLLKAEMTISDVWEKE